MFKFFVILFVMFNLYAQTVYAAISISLADNTLVASEGVLRALSKNTSKALVLSGAINDTFAIYEEGVLVKTVTLVSTSEKWLFDHVVTTYKVDWSAPGTDTAILYVGE